jgi:hypothetical protein
MFGFGGFVLHQSPYVLFPSRFSFVEEMLPTMVKKTMDHCVFPNLALAIVVFASFNLWTSYGEVDTFALVINFLNDNWVPLHISLGLFKVNETMLDNQ